MEGHLNKEFTLAELEPGWSEETSDRRKKTSMRMQGSLKMALLRVGKTPENSRKYVFGDPVSLIDWKAYARTDSLIVREQRDEASAHIVIIVDFGSTMIWPLPVDFPGVIQKAELGLRLGLWLAHAHLVLGDTVEVWIRTTGAIPQSKWKPRSPADVMAVFAATHGNLVEKIPAFFSLGDWNSPRSDSLWLLSDGLDNWNLDEILESSRSPRLVQTLSSLEYDVGWMEDDTCYLEREPTRKDYMGAQLKAGTGYYDRVKEWRDSLKKSVKGRGGDYFLATDRTPVGMFIHFLHAGGDH